MKSPMIRPAALLAAAVLAAGCSGGGVGATDSAAPARQATQVKVTIGTAEDSRGPAPAVEGAVSGGTVTVLEETDYTHLDPGQAFSGVQQTVTELIQRKLTAWRENPDGSMTLVGDLATDTGTPSDDHKTWTFTLKDGISYEDGTEIVAADIKYAVSRTYDPIFTAGPTYIQQWLSGKNYRETYSGPWNDGDLPDGLIDTPDDKTVIFHLREPVAEFAFAAALPMTSPVPAARDTKESYDRKPFSSGPYRVESHDDKSMTLVRNERWEAETDPIRTAYPHAFEFEFGEEALAINNRLIASVGADTTAMTFSAGVPADLLQQFGTSADLADRRFSALATGMQYFAINTRRITDETVRQAIVTAWPKQQLRQVMGGPLAGNIATTIMNPSVYGWEEFNAYPEIPDSGDTEAARVLLEEAGAVGTSIVYGYRNDQTGQKLSVVVKNALEAAGFTVVLTPVDSSSYWDQLYPLENGMDLYFTSWSADWPAGSGVIPALFQSSNADGSYNSSKLIDDKTDAEIDRVRGLADLDEQAQGWLGIQQTLLEKAVIIPWLEEKKNFLYGTGLGGVRLGTHRTASPLNVFVKQ